MYTTCLFCNGDLGRNEVVESFPVGRRLAFDAGKGRLWVVCRRCERWNLTPLEERWEAIEECERAFRGTKLRVSSDEIGLARLKEGLELVRIGAPQRPEMAAWRYGDQFGRRRRRHFMLLAGAAAAGGVAVVAGPMLGLISMGAVSPMMNLLNAGRSIYRAKVVVHVPDPRGGTFKTRLADLNKVTLGSEGEELVLHVPVTRAHLAVPGVPAISWFRYDRGATRELRGEAAMRGVGAILPRLNTSGGSARAVQQAVQLLEQAPDPQRLFLRSAGATNRRGRWHGLALNHAPLLKDLPVTQRLALEMAAHEETERRALEGELHILETAWREAEEIAHIADDMFLPPTVDADLQRLKDGVNQRGSDLDPR
jgi:hypothetical protein